MVLPQVAEKCGLISTYCDDQERRSRRGFPHTSFADMPLQEVVDLTLDEDELIEVVDLTGNDGSEYDVETQGIEDADQAQAEHEAEMKTSLRIEAGKEPGDAVRHASVPIPRLVLRNDVREQEPGSETARSARYVSQSPYII